MAAPFPSPTKTWRTTSYDTISPSRQELSAKGKAVLVTGGGSGIGAETARSFAEAGASRIAIIGRREQPLLDTKASIEQKYPNVEIFIAPTDITKKSEVDAAFANFVGSEGKIDVLISNAAMIGPQDSIGSADPEKFLDSVSRNIAGSLYVAQAFQRYASTNAVVVETNSSAAHVNFGPGFGAYTVSKMATYRLWDSFGYSNPELSVFSIQPGVVDTDMNKEAGGVKAMGFEDHVSLPANFNVWLASPEAKFLKGKFLWANWDVDELKVRAKEIQASTQFNIQVVGWPFGDPSWSSQWKSS